MDLKREAMSKVEKTLQSAKEFIDQGKADKAIRLLTDCLCSLNPNVIPQLDLLDLISYIFIKTNDFESANRIYNMILNDNRFNSKPWLRAKAYDGLAKISFFQSKYVESLKYINKIMRLIDNDRYKYFLVGNSARINIKIGQFEKAIAQLEMVNNLTAHTNKPITINRNTMSLAYAYGLNGNSHYGLEILSNVEQSDLADFKQDQIVYHEYKGHLQFMLAKETDDKKMYQQAIETLNEGLKIAYDFAPSSSAVGQPRRILAEIYLYLEDYELAKQNATESFRISSCINERYEVGILYWIFAQMAKHNKDDKRVEFNLQMSRKILTDIGAAYEMKRLHNHELVPQVL
jgi:tetratricopeptide (TPR) repeat protein